MWTRRRRCCSNARATRENRRRPMLIESHSVSAAEGDALQVEAIDIEGVAVMLGVSKSRARQMHDDGRIPLPVIEDGRIIRWAVLEIRAWLLAGAPRRALWVQQREAAIRRFVCR